MSDKRVYEPQIRARLRKGVRRAAGGAAKKRRLAAACIVSARPTDAGSARPNFLKGGVCRAAGGAAEKRRLAEARPGGEQEHRRRHDRAL